LVFAALQTAPSLCNLSSMKSLRAALVAIAFSISAFADHSAITPVPRDAGWKVRADLLNKRVTDTQDAELVFIGDSITQGWEAQGAKDVWEKNYGNRKAVNLGIGGDRTQHVLWRLQNGNLEGIKPKVAVIMIGTNNSNGEDNTPGQIVEGITAIVKEIQKRTPQTKILLLGIFPRSENFSAQRGKITQINQVIQKLDDGKNVTYLDIGHRFLEPDGTLSAEIMPDYLHLTKKGYEIWADAIEPTLAKLLGTRR
jgi:lysophospholipase L1-like esterase